MRPDADTRVCDPSPSQKPWTDKLWIYDFRTNQNFTLKTRALVRSDLDDFVACYNPGNRRGRTGAERFRPFSYDELIARDKASLDIFWLRDESRPAGCRSPRQRLRIHRRRRLRLVRARQERLRLHRGIRYAPAHLASAKRQ